MRFFLKRIFLFLFCIGCVTVSTSCAVHESSTQINSSADSASSSATSMLEKLQEPLNIQVDSVDLTLPLPVSELPEEFALVDMYDLGMCFSSYYDDYIRDNAYGIDDYMGKGATLYYQQKKIGSCVLFEDHAGEDIILSLNFIGDPDTIDYMEELSITVQDVRFGELLQNPPEPDKQWGDGYLYTFPSENLVFQATTDSEDKVDLIKYTLNWRYIIYGKYS